VCPEKERVKTAGGSKTVNVNCIFVGGGTSLNGGNKKWQCAYIIRDVDVKGGWCVCCSSGGRGGLE